MTDQPLLRVSDVTKTFGATDALTAVNLTVDAGEVHSLLGRNGAGKSTLVNIIAGIYSPTSGEVMFDGRDLRKLPVKERQQIGIQLVPQHENSFRDLSVAENIFAGSLPTRRGLVDWKRINAVASEQLHTYGLAIDPRTHVERLSSIDARKLNIIRALHSGAKLIILDEPTTALTSREREELFAFVLDLKKLGTAFIFISHYLGEVLELSDSITVLRDGKAFPVGEGDAGTEEAIARLVAGENVTLAQRASGPKETSSQEPLLRVSSLSATALHDVSLDVMPGKVVGVVGFPGSGAREFCRSLAGLNPASSGSVAVKGKTARLTRPRDAVAAGIAYISYDRHREGIIPSFDVNENIGVASYGGSLLGRFGFLRRGLERTRSEHYRQLLKIKTPSIDAPIDSLSGGNQQKVLISRLLSIDPILLVLDEPTVGIDIKSREEIIATVLERTAAGMSTLYLTNDYEELVRVADRLIFFEGGRIVAKLDNDDLTIDQLVAMRDRKKEEVDQNDH